MPTQMKSEHLYDPQNPNSGHGHVFPRPDGVRMRCTATRSCSHCQEDQRRKGTVEAVVEDHVEDTVEDTVQDRDVPVGRNEHRNSGSNSVMVAPSQMTGFKLKAVFRLIASAPKADTK